MVTFVDVWDDFSVPLVWTNTPPNRRCLDSPPPKPSQITLLPAYLRLYLHEGANIIAPIFDIEAVESYLASNG